MTTTILGKVAITPRGAYSAGTAYVALDAITSAGSSYLVLKSVTGVTPSNDGVNYQLLAAKGTDGTNGTVGNAILTTSGAPASGFGNNGDYALDPTAQILYGPKASSAWPAGVSIKGATGTNGTNGTNGSAGSNGTNGINGAQQLNGINNQTASYTAILTDAGTDVRFTSASAVTYTIPPNSSVAFPVGALLPFSQSGAGVVTATPGAGVTINGANGLATVAQHDLRVIEQTSANNWRVC